MKAISEIQPSLLGKMNERQVLHVLQAHGPMSRAEVARRLGLSAPTVSKAVASLLQAGMLEEHDGAGAARGRPARKLGLATRTGQVVGIVIDVRQCEVVTAGLDGQLHESRRCEAATPGDYDELLDTLVELAGGVIDRPGVSTHGVGISIPGLIDYRRQCGVLSPNVPITNGRSPARDLAARLGVPCVMFQESHALCLAERHYGLASGLDDFALLDVGAGVGMGVVSGGRLLTGRNGLAGEIGHITVVAGGHPCGCGNRGCLETEASDAALARRVSRRLGRRVSVEQVMRLATDGRLPADELHETCDYLALGVAAVINLFNPSRLFLHGRLFEADEALFPYLIEQARSRTLPPSFAECQIVRARGCKRQGAVAGIIQHLTASIAPTLEAKSVHASVEGFYA